MNVVSNSGSWQWEQGLETWREKNKQKTVFSAQIFCPPETTLKLNSIKEKILPKMIIKLPLTNEIYYLILPMTKLNCSLNISNR